MQYWWEQLIVGNRKTRINQRKEKAKSNKRRLLKKNNVTKNSSRKYLNLNSVAYLNNDAKSSVQDYNSNESNNDPVVVQWADFSSDENSSQRSSPQIITGIVGEIESGEEDDESSDDEDVAHNGDHA